MEMKKTLSILAAVLAFAGCQKYEFNTDFSMPTELNSPSAVTLDVTSSETVVLSWNGGGAADGGIVLYEVLFDKAGGDFSDPIYTSKSDLGAGETLTLSHAILNTIARKAGIAPNQSGSIIWTVRGSKGGEVKSYNGSGTINVTRGEGIDNIPEHLYILGTGAKEAQQEFRCVEEGVYQIYTTVGIGGLSFNSEKNGSGYSFYADESGKLNEGSGEYAVKTAPESGLARITVNYNTLAFTMDEIGTQVRAIWGATYSEICVLEYQGDGVFIGDGDVDFYGPGTNQEDNPSWCTWVEERYYFIATVNGEEKCWGSSTGSNAVTPDGTDEYWYIYENAWSQWDNLWKMDHAYDDCHVTMTIYTNRDNHFTHSYTGGAITYDQPTEAPADLYLYGAAAETEGAAFRKVSDGVFQIYNKFTEGKISFRDGAGKKYFADADGKLFVGNNKGSVAASEGVTRLTVDFTTNTIRTETVGAEVRLIWGCNYDTIATLAYQGDGKFVGEGDILFVQSDRPSTNPPSWLGWTEERYYFIPVINGTEMCWGRLDGVSEERPDGEVSADFYHLGEFAWDQWSHLWKMASDLDESHVTVTINTNDNGAMTHSFVKASVDPVPPTITPSSLAIYGSGAEAEGQAFRIASDGVFVAYTKLKDGNISFKSGNKNYFLDSEKGLLQGDGQTAVTAPTGIANKITVNFKDCTVKVEEVSEVRCIWGCSYVKIMDFSYAGAGKFSGEGTVNFVQPGDPACSWLTWVEDRYYFIAHVGDSDICWGRLDGVTDQKPDGSANFYDFAEWTWTQWDHLWKFADEMNGATVEIGIDTDKDGVMTHTVTKK